MICLSERFLNWNGYEEMMVEIAHHFAVERQLLIEAYEVVSQLPDIDNNVVPIVVHLRYDFPPFHLSKLVLIDLEVHGNRVEDHFQLGTNPHAESYCCPDTPQ